MDRDEKNDFLLRGMGWIPIHFWSKDVVENLQDCLDIVDEFVAYYFEGIEADV